MPDPQLLIWAISWPLLHAVFVLVLTSTVNNFMHYGHVFGFLRYNHARYIVSTTDNPKWSSLWERAEHGVLDWPDRINTYNELYWHIAAKDKKMRGLICPMCVGARFSVLIFIPEGIVFLTNYSSGLLDFYAVFVLCYAFLFCIGFSVYLINRFL